MKLFWKLLLVFLVLGNTGNQSMTAQARDEAEIDRVINGLSYRNAIKGSPAGMNIIQRMQTYSVPDVSIAVVQNGSLHWAREFTSSPEIKNPGIRYQAGSISKPVTALAVMRLVEDHELSLDEDISRYLKSWRIPANEFTGQQVITLRQILSHTAGFGVHGFAGYAQGQAVPALLQVLEGLPPANSSKISVKFSPASAFRYSGGGYVVLQQLLEDVTQTGFAELMRKLVLEPVGMRHSTFEQALNDQQRAIGHDRSGRPVEGNHHIYPEMSAAGLWTTALDLARLVISLQDSLNPDKQGVLSAYWAKEMLTAQKYNAGLGFFLGGENGNEFFVHDGATEGFQALLTGFQHTGQGAVILTNSNRGLDLAHEIRRSIAIEYQWPVFKPNLRTVVSLEDVDREAYLGVFEGSEGQSTVSIEIRRLGHTLNAASSWWEGVRTIYPVSPDRFFTREGDWEIEFSRDPAGQVSGLQFGPVKMTRKPT